MVHNLIPLLLVLSTLVGQFESRPQSSNAPFILRNVLKIDTTGGYYFVVDTSDHFHHDARGEVKNDLLSVRGYYSYIGPDGVTNAVKYTADENGFRPHPVRSSSLTKIGQPHVLPPLLPLPSQSPIIPSSIPPSPESPSLSSSPTPQSTSLPPISQQTNTSIPSTPQSTTIPPTPQPTTLPLTPQSTTLLPTPQSTTLLPSRPPLSPSPSKPPRIPLTGSSNACLATLCGTGTG